MEKRLVLLAIGGLAAGLAVPALAADSLTVVSWGGAYQRQRAQAFFEPFMKETGDKIVDQGSRVLILLDSLYFSDLINHHSRKPWPSNHIVTTNGPLTCITR